MKAVAIFVMIFGPHMNNLIDFQSEDFLFFLNDHILPSNYVDY